MLLHLGWGCIVVTCSKLKAAQVEKALNILTYPTEHLDLAAQGVAEKQLFIFAIDWTQQLVVPAWDHQSTL